MSGQDAAAPHPAAPGAPPRNGVRKAAAKSGRSRARAFALQALYQSLVGGNAAAEIDAFTRELSGFHKADAAHYGALLHGCIAGAAQLDALLTPLLDRPMEQISPIEHATLWIGAYEFCHCPHVPWRVVLDECIELTKEFGSTDDSHKYVNAVLGALAPQLRAVEIAADRQARAAQRSNQTPGV